MHPIFSEIKTKFSMKFPKSDLYNIIIVVVQTQILLQSFLANLANKFFTILFPTYIPFQSYGNKQQFASLEIIIDS